MKRQALLYSDDTFRPALCCHQCGSRISAAEFFCDEQNWLRCPTCYVQLAQKTHLRVVTGASGTGKTTLYRILLYHHLIHKHFFLVDTDVLLDCLSCWEPWTHYTDTWTWLSFHMAQNAFPVVLFGGFNPVALRDSPLAETLFLSVSYAILVCDDQELTSRITQRPAWQQVEAGFLVRQREFNTRLATIASQLHNCFVINTAHLSKEDSVEQLVTWLSGRRIGVINGLLPKEKSAK